MDDNFSRRRALASAPMSLSSTEALGSQPRCIGIVNRALNSLDEPVIDPYSLPQNHPEKSILPRYPGATKETRANNSSRLF